jgi:hypothetical protein
MATKKETPKTFNVMANLKVQVSMDITANSLEEAVTQANALKINDFIDFKASGLDHNDSDTPDVYGVFRNE